MNYSETIGYLFSQLPAYQLIGSVAYKADLDNVVELLGFIGNPEDKFKSIHVAGTNGKGSTSHMLASIFQAAGYKTGLYTSPHLHDFRERIKINGECISEDEVVKFVDKSKTIFEKVKPSFFEMTVAMAFDHFARQKVDIAIVEVGMGGRLDATNIIRPMLSVITNIGLDHTQFLGDSIDKIAVEKAGIIKRETPVVVGESQGMTEIIFMEKAHQEHAPIHFADKMYHLENIRVESDALVFDACWDADQCTLALQCGLTGIYQEKNICTVLAVVHQLPDDFSITPEAIRQGLSEVVIRTGLHGRWEKLQEHPLAYCDTGHNADGLRSVMKQISRTPHEKLHFVLGFVNDKNIDSALEVLPNNAHYYFCRANIPRAMYAEVLAEKAHSMGLQGSTYASVAEAYAAAQKNASEKDLIVITGSTFVVGEVLPH